jgi:membrane protease YdiL (CAAX protease family)
LLPNNEETSKRENNSKSLYLANSIIPNKQKVPEEPTPWGVLDVLKFATFYFIWANLLMVISALIPFEIYKPHEIIFRFIDTLLRCLFIIGIICYTVARKYHNNFFAALHFERIPTKEIIKFILIGFGLSALLLTMRYFSLPTSLRNFIDKDIPSGHLNKNYFELISGSFLALLAPFVEEIKYRSFIYSGFKRDVGQFASAVVVTVLFVASHGNNFQQDPVVLLSVIMGSIVFMIVRIKTDSLTKAILVHFSYNLFVDVIKWISVYY